MILAWLLLLTGLTISAVAIYYSVVGLTAIFSAAVIPIVVMGSALEVAKLVCASWLKANWSRAPILLKSYMSIAVVVLMLITSMGIFGFLSKAHNDQNLVSGDVLSKISIYDEKIKTAKDNIDANRKALKQMDEAVDQVMGRSSDEKGADKAVAIRKGQAKERSRLQAEIASEQKLISQLNDEAAPIRAEVRKVEAEVGPLKYIAKFIYGDNGADENMLEKAVTWVIILIVIVFDPLAVIMLLGAQMTFQWHNKGRDLLSEEEVEIPQPDEVQPILTEVVESKHDLELPKRETTQFVDLGEHPRDTYDYEHTEEEVPSETPLTALGGDITASEEPVVEETTESELDQWNKMIEEAEKAVEEEKKFVSPNAPDLDASLERPGDYLTEPEFEGVKLPATGEWVQTGPSFNEGTEFPENPKKGEEFTRTDFSPERHFMFDGVSWVDNSKKKTYMMKDPQGQIQVKTRS